MINDGHGVLFPYAAIFYYFIASTFLTTVEDEISDMEANNL